MKRNYTHVKVLENQILTMRAEGKTRKKIAQTLGLTKVQIKNWINRFNKKTEQIPKSRGRKPAVTIQEYKYENKRLKMENELLRDFLHLAGRR